MMLSLLLGAFLSSLRSPFVTGADCYWTESTANSTTGIDKRESRTCNINNLGNLNNLDSEWDKEVKVVREVKEVGE